MAAGRKDIYKDAKPFKPGQSGNPNGRPKGVPNAATRMKRFLELEINGKNPITKEEEQFTVAELMDLKIIAKAMNGDLSAWEKINDRLEGKPKQTAEFTDPLKVELSPVLLSISFRPPEGESPSGSASKEKAAKT